MKYRIILYLIFSQSFLGHLFAQDCEDIIITELPYISADNPEDPGSTVGQGDDWEFEDDFEGGGIGSGDGEDVAYKLTLDEQRTLYIDTCDPLTNFDTILAIKSSCFEPNSLYQIDDRDGDNACVGSGTDETFPATFVGLTLDPGTYYIIVDGYNEIEGSYGLAIGAVPEIIGSSIASDDSYIEIIFNDPIYTTNDGTGAANLEDFQIEFNANDGNATNVEISTLTNTAGGMLVGGEDIIRINIIITGLSSGVETVTITPTDGSSLFNSTGIAIAESSTVTQQLNDYFPPNVNFFPANDTIGPSENILIQFDEPIQLADGNTNPTDENIVGMFTLAYADTGTNLIPYVATVDGSDQEFTLNPDNILDERRTIAISFADNTFEDLGNNAVPANSATFIVRDVTAPTIISDSLGQASQFVFLSFDEGVYTNADESGGLNLSDFVISEFVPTPAGNATNPSITSINTWVGTIPTGGETKIRMTLQFDNDPNGEESMKIRPNPFEVFDDFGNVMDAGTNEREFELNDALAPFVIFTPESGDDIDPDAIFTLTFSENVRLLNNSTDLEQYLDDFITVAYTDGSIESIPCSITILNYEITIDPLNDLDGLRQMRVSILDSLEDFSDNQMDIQIADYTIRDIYPPEIIPDFCSITTNNEYIILSFSEGVYTNSDGTGPLQISDFNLIFNHNGNNTVLATFSENFSLQKPGASGLLEGGEDSIWVLLDITGTPSGIESLIIESATFESIFDAGGNPISTLYYSSDSMYLNPYPWLNESSLNDDNSYIDLFFSEGVYSSSDTLSAVQPEDFNINFTQNDSGHATNAVIESLIKTNGDLLTGGEETIRVRISISNPPASGYETIAPAPIWDYSICNYIGNKLFVSNGTSDTTFLFDRKAPTITAVSMNFNDFDSLSGVVTFIASEGMFSNRFGEGSINIDDFNLAFYPNNGHATDAVIDSVKNINLDMLTGGEDTVLIFFHTVFSPSGTEQIAISPATSNSIFDPAGNPMAQITISERLYLPDRIPPEFIAGSASISSDNSYVIFTLSEGVYGNWESRTPAEPSDFFVEFIPNGGNATGANVSYITNSRQFPLVGGEDTLRCYLDIQGTPNGHERLYIRGRNINSTLFDGLGNPLPVTESIWFPDRATDTLQLFDQYHPRAIVDSTFIREGSDISSSIESPINILFNEPIQSFEYTISARQYNYLTYIAETTATSFTITLQPPMASLDTITLSIFNLTDNAGLTEVTRYFDFYTPPLGDYKIDGEYDYKVDVEDLTRFMEFWREDLQPTILGLGPTSGTYPHLVPELDAKYDLDDGMTFIRMWSWSLERWGLEPLVASNIGTTINWDKLVVDVPIEAIAGQVYLRYNSNQGKVDLQHSAFGNNNFTLKKELAEHGEVLLEFGLVEPNDDTKIISIKSEIDEPAEATVKYKFFAKDRSVIAAGTQKISLEVPTEFRLMQNYPNPFNNTTTIRYAVPEETDIQLEIFDINGRLMETLISQLHQPGLYDLKWSGRQAASGIYFIKLEANKTVLTQKMILLK